jgi:hypothetical protein
MVMEDQAAAEPTSRKVRARENFIVKTSQRDPIDSNELVTKAGDAFTGNPSPPF